MELLEGTGDSGSFSWNADWSKLSICAQEPWSPFISLLLVVYERMLQMSACDNVTTLRPLDVPVTLTGVVKATFMETGTQ